MSKLHFNTAEVHFMQGALLCGRYTDEAMGLMTEERWFHSRQRQGILSFPKALRQLWGCWAHQTPKGIVGAFLEFYVLTNKIR